MSIISLVALFATGLALPVIEHTIADSALSDVQFVPHAATQDLVEQAKKFDEMIKQKAAEAAKLATDSAKQIITKMEGANKVFVERDKQKMANSSNHMSPEEKAFREAREKAQRDLDEAMKTILGKYAAATVAAKNALDASLDKAGAATTASQVFRDAQAAASLQQRAAVKVAKDAYDAAVKEAHDLMDAALQKRMFEQHEQHKVDAWAANEMAVEKLREKLAVKAEAEVKAFNKTSPKEVKNPNKDKKLSELMTEMVEVFQEVHSVSEDHYGPKEMAAWNASLQAAQAQAAQSSKLASYVNLNPGEKQRSYSSVYGNSATGTGFAQSELQSPQAWSPLTDTVGQHMTISFFSPQTVVGVVTQGRADAAEWVKSYKVQTSTDCKTFTNVVNDTVFSANTDQGTEVRNAFASALTGVKCVRLLPQTWSARISMRAAVLLPAEAYASALAELIADPANVGFDEIPNVTPAEVKAAMDWIKQKTTEARIPFCWANSTGRGAGWVPGRLADCPKGYYNTGVATCQRDPVTVGTPSFAPWCPEGFTNMGLTCYNAYTWESRGWSSFECRDPAYFLSSLSSRCHIDCSKLASLGALAGQYTSTGETCYLSPDTKSTSAMTCRSNEYKGSEGTVAAAYCYPNPYPNWCNPATEEYDAGLCYPKCKPGYHGIGPVCWQSCPSGLPTDCGAGCAKDKTTCASTLKDQILGPIVLAANLATLGMAATASTAVKAGVKGATEGTQIVIKLVDGTEKTLTASSKIGGYALKAMSKFQTVGTVVDSSKKVTTWTKVKDAAKGAYKLYKASKTVERELFEYNKMYEDAYSADFAAQTTPEINAAVDARYGVNTYASNFIKKSWSSIQLTEMAQTMGLQALDNVLSVVSLVDPTGIADVVNAYAKPICFPENKLPCTAFAVSTAGC